MPGDRTSLPPPSVKPRASRSAVAAAAMSAFATRRPVPCLHPRTRRSPRDVLLAIAAAPLGRCDFGGREVMLARVLAAKMSDAMQT